MKAARRRKISIIIVLVVLGALAAPFIHFPGQRVGKAIARALGRPVTVGSASVRLLPQPAIELQNVTIGEDAAFGAEPMMTAPAVVATLRYTSMLRGRLDFGSISFQENDGVAPSFNIVRRADGEWNIASLMTRAASSPAAPTGTRKLEPRPHFPYIEITSGRLNFKTGVEKKVVALTDADFSLWMASDHEWRARLKARPIRTDTNLSDTGTIEAEGAVRRLSQNSREVSVQVDARLRGSQLGQLSTLVYGRDRGWRGATDAEVIIAGPLTRPAVELRARIDDFRRFDITSPQPLKLEASCSAQLDPQREALDNVRCTAPYGEGTVAVTGTVADLSRRSYRLALDVEGVPVKRVLALLRRAKRDLPEDMAAEGLIDAQLTASRESRNEPAAWSGHASIRRLVLHSDTTELKFPIIAVAVGSDGESPENRGFVVSAQPFSLDLGSEKAATVAAQFDAAGYSVSLNGPAAIENTVRAARMVGMRAPSYHVRGSANLQLRLAGVWAGFAPPVITGTAQINSASAELAGVRGPLRVASAQLELSPTFVTLRKVTASLGLDGPSFTASVQVPRGCSHPEECWAQVDLKMAELNLSNAAAMLTTAKRPWYDVFGGSRNPESLLMRAHARGRINITRLLIAGEEASNVAAEVALDEGRLQLNNVSGQVFGAQHSGEWQADFTGAEPRYSGQGKLTRVAMAHVSSAATGCCSGTADVTYQAHFEGHSGADVLHSLSAQADFVWKHGTLNHFSLPRLSAVRLTQSSPTSALRFKEFRGHAELRDATIELTRSKIAGPSGIYQVSGALTLDRHLAMTIASVSQRYTVAGTLDDPVIASEAQRAAAPAAAVPTPTPAPVKGSPITD